LHIRFVAARHTLSKRAVTAADPRRVAKFVRGSTMRHVVLMTGTGSLGLLSNLFDGLQLGAARCSASFHSSGSARIVSAPKRGRLLGTRRVFGIASTVVCLRTVAGIARLQSSREDPLLALPPPNAPFSTRKPSTL
jgi:hypothetical protein